MIINHNLPAINAHRQMGINNSALSKSLEKLSSGLGINRASDNAAGLAISEKMRGQISGLDQASKNAQDGISLIQTAEGALNETHSILQRMRELSVQSANGTYQDEVDRTNIQKEVDALKSEIDRIATSTHYNGIKLLDGSLSGSTSTSGAYGPKFGVLSDAAGALQGAVITSDVSGVAVSVNNQLVTEKGSEVAVWNAAGNTLTLNLVANTQYSQDQINDLIKNAKQELSTPATGSPADVTVKLQNGSLSTGAAGAATTTDTTTAGIRATATGAAGATDPTAAGNFLGANNITLTANKYGADMNNVITFAFTAKAGAEAVEETVAPDYTDGTITAGEYTVELQAGKDYTKEDIEKILKDNGLDYSVTLEGPDPEATTLNILNSAATTVVTLAGGAGVSSSDALFGQEATSVSGSGLTFQIGANGTKDQRVSLNVANMSTRGLNIYNINASTQAGANSAIATIDDAINSVSGTRADLGALQNRLEHTINSLGVASENLTAAESRIRDVDMAKEMMNFTKTQILSQASQAMLAQANTLPQGVLQLLQ